MTDTTTRPTASDLGSDLSETYDAARAYELDRAHVFHSWSAQAEISPMVITRAEGSHVWDGEGRRYLDFSSQLVFTNLGHQHPRIVAAIVAGPSSVTTCSRCSRARWHSSASVVAWKGLR